MEELLTLLKNNSIPAIVGAVGALVIKALSLVLERKKLDVSDETSLRTSLMEERTRLISEMRDLAKQLNDEQTANQKLREDVLELRAKIGDLELELKALKMEAGLCHESSTTRESSDQPT